MSEALNILVVEDDPAMRESCAKLFRLKGYKVAEAPDGAHALDQIRQRGDVDIVLTDLKMSGMDGVALLKEIKVLDPGIAVVLMTGYGSVKNAVEAMKYGATDYITKPFDSNELLTTIGKISQLSCLREEVSRLRSELREKSRFDDLVGAGAAMQGVYEKIEAARNANSTVFICGESGTGKELIAKAIHYNGHRADRPFVAVNCAAIPSDLMESELFGHKQGSFTSAFSDSPGLFRAADGGTLFLDEILEMPYGVQAKLLRALQERRVRPIGGTEETPIDVRVIASTNQDVQEAIAKRKFRDDLYYRLGVIWIEAPALRDHSEDVPLLVRHFIDKFNSLFQRTVKGITADALALLTHYRWPGNVRELESVIENAFALGKSDRIQTSDLPAYTAQRADLDRKTLQRQDGRMLTLSQAERRLLRQALKITQGNKTRAAKLLGVSRPRLYKMIQRHELGQ